MARCAWRRRRRGSRPPSSARRGLTPASLRTASILAAGVLDVDAPGRPSAWRPFTRPAVTMRVGRWSVHGLQPGPVFLQRRLGLHVSMAWLIASAMRWSRQASPALAIPQPARLWWRVILSSMVRSLASLICRPPAAARTFCCTLGVHEALPRDRCASALAFSVLVLAWLAPPAHGRRLAVCGMCGFSRWGIRGRCGDGGVAHRLRFTPQRDSALCRHAHQVGIGAPSSASVPPAASLRTAARSSASVARCRQARRASTYRQPWPPVPCTRRRLLQHESALGAGSAVSTP